MDLILSPAQQGSAETASFSSHAADESTWSWERVSLRNAFLAFQASEALKLACATHDMSYGHTIIQDVGHGSNMIKP